MFCELGHRRELLLDNYLVDESLSNAKEVLHHPIRKECVMTNNAPWEADGWVYYTVLKDKDLFRMYYLCMPMYNREHTKHDPPYHHICYAESHDGIHWVKPFLGLYEYGDNSENNIIVATDTMDAFHVFIDENPACKRGERYKAVYTKPGHRLWCMISEDGIHFREGWQLTDLGAFDSHNTAFWDSVHGCYVCYSRDFHDGKDGNRIRDIRRMKSLDFHAWSEPERIVYEGSPFDFHMYTNGIQPYFRAPHIYVAFPARYTERKEWIRNYDRLCGTEARRWRMQFHPRFGLATTDGLFMSSRDGHSFRRWNEAFLRPGPESPKRWVYGDGYAAYGMLPTKTSVDGEDKELSFYASANDWSDTPVQVFRYTLRMDGFVSRSADFTGARVVTKPLVFDGNRLVINFATSAAGCLRVRIGDEAGCPLEGFDSGELFGDSIDRIVDFSHSVSMLKGHAVRLIFDMADADIYSFMFAL